LIAVQAFFSWKPARSIWIRRWSSSLIMTENAWSLLITTPLPCLEPLSSRLIRWRSTRICFSSSPSSPTPTRGRASGAPVEVTAARQARGSSRAAPGFAQPGNGWPARLRARRIRVIRTMADLLLVASVSSEGVSMSEAMVMGSARRLWVDGLFDLVDFIAAARRLLVALGLDRLGEVDLELGELVVK
jgi:hypothetical protein